MRPEELLKLVDKASNFLRDQKESASAGKVGTTGVELIALMRAAFPAKSKPEEPTDSAPEVGQLPS